MKYTVTGIITSYHRNVSVVEKAIESMLMQTYRLLEILVIDDNELGSELSEPIKKQCARFGVRYIKQNGNMGACAARNLGIANSNGDLIGFLDDDDEWLPNKVERQIEAFKKNPDAGMVYCSGVMRKLDTGEENDYFSYNSFRNDVSFDDLLSGDCIGSTSHPLIKREVFAAVGGFWEKQPARQDYEMWIRISQKYKIIGIREKLFVHNMHDGEQISKNAKKSYWGFRNIYERYRKSYQKNLEAQYRIMTSIYVNIYCVSPFNVLVFIRKVAYKVLIICGLLKLVY